MEDFLERIMEECFERVMANFFHGTPENSYLSTLLREVLPQDPNCLEAWRNKLDVQLISVNLTQPACVRAQ